MSMILQQLTALALIEAIYRRIGFNDYCKLHYFGSPPGK